MFTWFEVMQFFLMTQIHLLIRLALDSYTWYFVDPTLSGEVRHADWRIKEKSGKIYMFKSKKPDYIKL